MSKNLLPILLFCSCFDSSSELVVVLTVVLIFDNSFGSFDSSFDTVFYPTLFHFSQTLHFNGQGTAKTYEKR